MNKGTMIRMQIRLPVEIRDFLAREAKDQSRSMNGQLIEFLKEKMKEVEKKQSDSETRQ
jgi:hypothetical protein